MKGAKLSKEEILHGAFEACKDTNGVALNTDIAKWLLDNHAMKKQDISKQKTLTKVYESLGYETSRTDDDPTSVKIERKSVEKEMPTKEVEVQAERTTQDFAKKSEKKASKNKNRPKLFEFAIFSPSYDQHIDSLAKMSISEEWGENNKYLKSYVISRFDIVSTSKPHLLCYDETQTKAVFNTGLLTPNFQDIFAFFKKTTKGKVDAFIFGGFMTEGDRSLQVFKELPDTIEFYTSIEEIYFDTELEIRLNKNHILGENKKRFPDWFANTPPLQQNFILDGAIKNIKIRIKRDYRTVVPQWYKNRVCFLIPLCLSGENINNPELLLTCEKENGFYHIATCLTPEMAYTNARIIAKPESDWLKP